MSTATTTPANVWDMPVAPSGGDFTPCPAGNHPGRIAAILDVGHQPEEKTDPKDGTKYVTDVRKIVTAFELAKKQPDGRPFVMGVRHTWSMNEKANFYKLATAVTGRSYASGEHFNPNTLLGKAVMVNVTQSAPNASGKSYANVGNVAAFPEGLPEPAWSYDPIIWSAREGTPFPERDWYPWVYGKTVADLVAGSCEARGVSPCTRSNAVVAPAGHSFNAPTHSQSVAGSTPGTAGLPADAEALRVKHGLGPGYGLAELQAKVDAIPIADYRVLDEHATPF